MKRRKAVWATVAIAMAAALTSCSIGAEPEPTQDVNSIYTFAAQTLSADRSAQQTRTAAAASPTPLSSPTPLASVAPLGTSSAPFGTARPLGTSGLPVLPTVAVAGTPNNSLTAVGCDNATYVSETDPMDKSSIDGGEDFTKGWQMQNTGTCTWKEGYAWVFVSGDDMQCRNIVYGANDTETEAGHSNTFIVHCTAPETAGEYKAFWQMQNTQGVKFGFSPWVDIVVP